MKGRGERDRERVEGDGGWTEREENGKKENLDSKVRKGRRARE